MRPIPLTALLLLGTLAACPGPRRPAPLAKARGQATRLTILAINDFHGNLDARPFTSGETPPRRILVGGAEALAATLTELRQANPEATLLLDAGDFMQGSLLSNHFEGAPVAALYRVLGVDASVVGNHEFDFGPVGPEVEAQSGQDRRGALRAWAQRVPFPLLSANIQRRDGKPFVLPKLRPSLLLTRGGVKVGVVGLTTTDTPTTTLPANVSDLRFTSTTEALIREAKALRARGAQVVVALAHVGGTCKTRAPESCKGELFDTLRALPAGLVDAAVAGHSHRCVWHRVNGVLVTEACSKGIAVGRIELILRGRKVVAAESRVFPPTPVCQQVFPGGGCEASLRQGPATGTISPNPLLKRHGAVVKRVRAALRPFRDKVRAREQKVLATLARPMVHRYRGASEVGYLFARMLHRAIPGADIALMNAGGIRGRLPAGAITYKRLYGVFPFDNRVATVEVTGDQLQRMLASSLGRTHAGILQVAGMRLDIACGPPPKLLRILHKGRPIDKKRRYKVVLSDFMLAGGDGLGSVLAEVPKERKRIFSKRLVREEMAAHLLRLGKGGKSLNPAEAPILGKDTPSVRLEAGASSCDRGRKRRARPLCR